MLLNEFYLMRYFCRKIQIPVKAGATFLTIFFWCLPLAAIAFYFMKVK